MAKRPGKAIGIDIGTSSIKLVEASKSRNGYVVDRAYIYMLDDNVWRDGIPIDVEVATIHLQRALRAFNSPVKRAVMSVPTASLMVKSIPMDASLRDDDLWATIEANLSQYIPFSTEEVMMDFTVTGDSVGVEGHKDVLITAAQRDFVNMRDLCAEMSGIKLDIVDGDVYALLNLLGTVESFETYSKHDAVVFIEIGLSRSGLHIISGDGALYVRESPIGGDRLTEIISDISGMSFEDSEVKKVNGNWAADEHLIEANKVFLEEMSEQVVSAYHVYKSNHPQVNVNKFYLVGASIVVPGLADAIAKAIGSQVHVIDPSRIMTFSDKVNVERNRVQALSIACGLALRGL